MSYYTRVHLEIKLRKDTPIPLINTLYRFINYKLFPWPNTDRKEKAYFKSDYPHPFFETDQFFTFFVGYDLGSKMFIRDQHWNLVIESEFQNRYGEIDKFIDLITPFVVGRKKKEYVGWHKGENYENQRINTYISRPVNGFLQHRPTYHNKQFLWER